MRILVTGSRNWSDRFVIESALVEAQSELAPLQPGQYDYNGSDWTIVHGACPYGGADYIAEQWAIGCMYKVEPWPADWANFGKAAGPMRNQAMVDAGADICLAFPLPDSRGTWDCIRRAKAAGIPVKIYEEDAE